MSVHVVDHWCVRIWTWIRAGRRVVRECEIYPLSSRQATAEENLLASLAAAARERWERWGSEPVPSADLQAVWLRELKLGSLLAEQQAAITHDLGLFGDDGNASGSPRELRAVYEVGQHRVDADKIDPRELGYLVDALRYVELVGLGDATPARTLARHLGMSLRTIQTRIARARALGYLTKGSKGRAGGDLTDKARSALLTEGGPGGQRK